LHEPQENTIPGQQLARHLHVTLSQGFGGPRSSFSFSCTCICITNHFFSLTHGSFSLCDLTTTPKPVQMVQGSRHRYLQPLKTHIHIYCTCTY
jgi:hypothetical protein